MKTDQNTQTKERARPLAQRTRPTIGFLNANTWVRVSQYPKMIWTGVVDAARERDANLICFAGGNLSTSPGDGFDSQRNMLYDLVTPGTMDGLIVSAGVLGLFVSRQELQAFCDRYRPMPMVSIAVPLEGIPCVQVDNVTGLRDAVNHLIETHGHRRIAFLCGPADHGEANERYRAYIETLAARGLTLNPDLVTPGDFSRDSGAAAMHLLLDERGLRPGVDFEAIVAASDDMALGALEVLQARGVQVPYNVAVVGINDTLEARVATPTLTTIRQPIHEQGKMAVEMLLAQLAGEDVPEQVTLPTKLVVRRSCGCHSPSVLQAAVPVARMKTPRDRVEGATLEEALATERDAIAGAMVQAVASDTGEAAPAAAAEWARQVLDGFAAALKDGSAEGFLSTLDQVLRQVTATSGDLPGSAQQVGAWQGAISVLRSHLLSHLEDNVALSRAENLWQQARLFIAEATAQAEQYRELQIEQQNGVLQAAGQAMTTTSDVAGLMEVIARELPRLGIPSTHLALYEGQETPPPESCLILAYNENGRVALEAGGARFPSRTLAPKGMLPQTRRYSVVVEPLHFREHQLGLALFEVGPREGIVYETLQAQISSALQAAQFNQQMRRRALQLQTASEVSHAASSLLNVDELLPQVVDLVRDRFNLYYAGIFLNDDTEHWAILKAGTGEAGQKMLVNGHKLKIGGNSMISQCLETRQARIALDVGEEAVRFDNPLLPLTRSEMALPLISRGRVIGAVTVQSDQPAAFTADDITVLQSMADQISTAVENARLYEQAQTALQEVDAINRRLTGEAWDTYLRQQAGREVIWLADDEATAPEVLPQLDEQLSAGEITIEPDDEDSSVATVTAPILLRGQPIGALRLRTPLNEWNDDTEIMLADIAGHIAQAVENARLVEQTQRTAQRERTINEINARVRQSVDLDAILRTAVSELGQSLKAARVMARVGMTAAGGAAAAGDGRGKTND